MSHNPYAAIFDMAQAVETALRLSSGISEAEYLENETVQWAIFSQIIILGEAAGRVGREFQDTHSDIPWAGIIGMRHRLVHGYDTVDWVRVWKTLKNDLPALLSQLRTVLPEDE
jgi:uncharacterized protein with HEPN domain